VKKKEIGQPSGSGYRFATQQSPAPVFRDAP
jgi:hypothetical protein